MKARILSKRLAEVTREICETLYSEQGASKVYDYANKIRLRYNTCVPCDAETPTISDVNINTCAICGSGKTILISKQYGSISAANKFIKNFETKHGEQKFSVNKIDDGCYEVNKH